MVARPLERTLRPLLLVASLAASSFLGAALNGCGSDKPTQVASANCTDCPSSVYWDAGVSRCRNADNGQFAKSCCCGR
jgi:hypothetical protein